MLSKWDIQDLNPSGLASDPKHLNDFDHLKMILLALVSQVSCSFAI